MLLDLLILLAQNQAHFRTASRARALQCSPAFFYSHQPDTTHINTPNTAVNCGLTILLTLALYLPVATTNKDRKNTFVK